MARRVARLGDGICVGSTLENVAEHVGVPVSGGEVGHAESEVALGVELCAALEQGLHTSSLALLGC